jgi:hypothetical protein
MNISERQKPAPSPLPTYVLVHFLTWLSIFPLIKIYLKKGPLFVYYHHASPGGFRLVSLLRLLGLVSQEPTRIKDIFCRDLPHGQSWNLRYLAFQACSVQLKRIECIIKTCLPFLGSSERKFYGVSVRKAWEAWLELLLLLRRTGKHLAYEKNLPLEQVILISPFASLIDFVELDRNSPEEIAAISQPFQNKVLPYLLGASWLSLWRLVRKCVCLFSKPRTLSVPLREKDQNIGIGAAWSLSPLDQPNKMALDDLFWWKKSTIPPERIRYLYDRAAIQPTAERLEKTSALGIQSILLDPRFCGDAPELLIKTPEPYKTVRSLFFDLWLAGRLVRRALFSDELTRSVVSIIHWYYMKAAGLSDIYRSLGLRALIYHNEAGFDVFSLAAKSADATRIGISWTCLLGIDNVSARSHDVFFFWGQHDVRMALDAGSISQHMLVSGCFLTGRSNPQARDEAQSVVSDFRKRGVDYILAIFDTSTPTPNFYLFLLKWLIEDPKLGLLIKGKGSQSWHEQKSSNTSLEASFGEVLRRALDTQRIHCMLPTSSPGDAALAADFTVGVGSISSTTVAALQGARVLFVDYERLDQGAQSPYTTFHSLGPNRCIFYDLGTLKQEVLKYTANPKSNPHLGDVSPILHQLDSFCDSGASRRIAEYVEWYMKGLARGLGRDEATRSATRKYAEKWGKDKVVRGL